MEDRDLWNSVLNYQGEIREYLSIIGLELVVNEADGYAFLRQKKYSEGSGIKMPVLVERRQLTYSVTLICVLLAEKLYEHEVSSGGESPRLIIGKQEIIDLIMPFMTASTNQVRESRSIEADINKMVSMGFLRVVDDTKYEVMRILKAKVSADILSEIKEKLSGYKDTAD